MTFKFNNLQPAEVKLTAKVGWVTGRYDVANGGIYYRVAHTNNAGDYSSRWYAEHELATIPPGDPRTPPGLAYVDPTPIPPPGGEGDAPGDLPPADAA